MTHRILTVYGTRPEAIKLAPVIRALEAAPDFVSEVVVTGQHREMVAQVNNLFGIEPRYDLQIGRTNQSLDALFSSILERLPPILKSTAPDLVVVQGDTTSAFGAALCAYHAGIPIAHVEAGLRTFDLSAPWPEEGNRQMISRLAAIHFAPTSGSKQNLLLENVPDSRVVVTGNTVIDALLWASSRPVQWRDPHLEEVVNSKAEVLLVTAHRRESWGFPMRNIGLATSRLASEFPYIQIVLPAHKNPLVREQLYPALMRHENVTIVEPLDYDQFAALMKRSKVVLTDSGGVQEEAPSLGKPVLVLRDNTERPEAVESGTVRLVGTGVDGIYRNVLDLWTNTEAYARMANAVNPYGDGMAAARTTAGLRRFFGMDVELSEFDPLVRDAV